MYIHVCIVCLHFANGACISGFNVLHSQLVLVVSVPEISIKALYSRAEEINVAYFHYTEGSISTYVQSPVRSLIFAGTWKILLFFCSTY